MYVHNEIHAQYSTIKPSNASAMSVGNSLKFSVPNISPSSNISNILLDHIYVYIFIFMLLIVLPGSEFSVTV